MDISNLSGGDLLERTNDGSLSLLSLTCDAQSDLGQDQREDEAGPSPTLRLSESDILELDGGATAVKREIPVANYVPLTEIESVHKKNLFPYANSGLYSHAPKVPELHFKRCRDVRTLLQDLRGANVITDFQNDPYLKHLLYGMISLQRFVKKQNSISGCSFLDCSHTRNTKIKLHGYDFYHAIFFLHNNKDHKKRIRMRKKYKDAPVHYAILDSLVERVLNGEYALPKELFQVPVLLVNTKWLNSGLKRLERLVKLDKEKAIYATFMSDLNKHQPVVKVKPVKVEL